MTVPAPDLRNRLVTALGEVRLRLGPNALAMAGRGEAIRLSGNEKDAVADVALGIVQERMDVVQQGNAVLDASVTELREGLVIARRTNDFGRSQLEEARDLFERAGINRAHGDDWPDIIPALRDLVTERDRLRAQVAAGIPLVCSDDRHAAKVAALEQQLAAVRAYADGLYTAPPEVGACGVRERLLDILTPTGPARTIAEAMTGRNTTPKET